MSEEEPKRRPGGQLGNLNRMKKPEMPTELDHLDTPEQILAAQKRLILDVYSGRIGSRAAGSVNHALETLLKFHLDSKKLAEYEQYFQRIKTLLDSQEEAAKRKLTSDLMDTKEAKVL